MECVNKNRLTKCAMPRAPRTSNEKSPIGVITLQLSRSVTFSFFTVAMRPLQEVFFSLSHGNLLLLLLYGNIIHLFTATKKLLKEVIFIFMYVIMNIVLLSSWVLCYLF